MSNTEQRAFTPGPWEFVAKLTASENHRGFFIRAEKATRNGKWALAEVQPGDEDGRLGEANARLIAAAPDLYEALRIAVRQNSHDMLMTGEELRICEAALTRATTS